MESETKCYALIPAFKPGACLPDLAQQLQRAGLIVVVVDDGSGPQYAPVFRKVKQWAEVLSYPENRGKGHALKTGLSYLAALSGSPTVVVTLDADGQHRVADALRIRDEALQHPGALILGCRSFGKGTPLKSQFGNTVTRMVFQLSTGKKVQDTQTGLRAFSTPLLNMLGALEGERYEYEMNVLLSCARAKIPIREVEIETVYFDGNAGSHFHPLRDSFLIYSELFKFAASSLAGFFIDYSLYTILTILTAGLGTVSVPLSNICARAVSAAANYWINRRFVFQNRGSVAKSASMYFTLAACILAGNTLLLNFLVEQLSLNKFLAKLLTELTFFMFSWMVQKFFIFRRKQHPQKKFNCGQYNQYN